MSEIPNSSNERLEEEHTEDRQEPVTKIIDDVKVEICDHYCKYTAQYPTQDRYDKMLDEQCETCPLNRL